MTSLDTAVSGDRPCRSDARRSELDPPLDGRFRIRYLLGSGGHADVYAAVDEDGGPVAVKIAHPILGSAGAHSLRCEVMVANKLRHRGLLRVVHAALDHEPAYFVSELLVGESLEKRAARLGRLDPWEVLTYANEVLRTLEVVHASGITHCDVKPANVFLTDERRVKLLDFGVACFPAHRRRGAMPESMHGTPRYMPPEQAIGRFDLIGPWSDVFALGGTMFELIAGRSAHAGSNVSELVSSRLTRRAPSLARVAPWVPEEIAMIVDLALAPHPEARYPDAHVMRRDVMRAFAGALPPYAFEHASADETPFCALPLSA